MQECLCHAPPEWGEVDNAEYHTAQCHKRKLSQPHGPTCRQKTEPRFLAPSSPSLRETTSQASSSVYWRKEPLVVAAAVLADKATEGDTCELASESSHFLLDRSVRPTLASPQHTVRLERDKHRAAIGSIQRRLKQSRKARQRAAGQLPLLRVDAGVRGSPLWTRPTVWRASDFSDSD